MRKLITTTAAVAMLAVPAAAMADSTGTTTFEAPTFAAGPDHTFINGIDGWSATGAYDDAIVASGINGGQSLRMSNAITSGSFSDWVFSKPTLNPAGESVANHVYKGEFAFKSETGAAQTGLQISVSPDNGQGARMSFVRLMDKGDGIHVMFNEMRPNSNDFSDLQDIAKVNYSSAHTLRFELKMLPGRNNDQVAVYVDGVKKVVGKSWENYYRDSELHEPGVVDRMIFQARTSGGDAPTTLGHGYLIDNVSSSTSVS
jgi:hypothetical protein